MRIIALLLIAFGLSVQVAASERLSGYEDKNCGTQTIAEMVRSGWEFVKRDFIATIEGNGYILTLDDGTRYHADMTVGIFKGDEALLFRKYIKTEKSAGYIYTLCAGGFDAWVTPIR